MLLYTIAIALMKTRRQYFCICYCSSSSSSNSEVRYTALEAQMSEKQNLEPKLAIVLKMVARRPNRLQVTTTAIDDDSRSTRAKHQTSLAQSSLFRPGLERPEGGLAREAGPDQDRVGGRKAGVLVKRLLCPSSSAANIKSSFICTLISLPGKRDRLDPNFTGLPAAGGRSVGGAAAAGRFISCC